MAWALVTGSVVTSLLTLYAIAKTWSYAFWRPRANEEQEITFEMLLPLTPSFGRLSDAIGATVAAQRPSTPITPPSAAIPVRRDMPLAMSGAATAVVAFSLGLSLFAGPLFAYTDAAATQMIDRDGYAEAVLPQEAP